jgi:hypothetical protein
MASCDYCCLYDQYNSAATEPPLGIDSQQFEPAMATLDDQAADDFVLTTGIGAIYMTGLRVMGDYSAGGGPASSFNVYFYQNGSGNFPGAAIAQFMDLPYTGTPPEFVICLRICFTSVREPIGSRYRLIKISIQTVSGFGVTEPSNRGPVRFGRTRQTATGPAVSHGTGRALACPIKYGPIRCFRFLGSERDQRHRQNPFQRRDLARHQRLARLREEQSMNCAQLWRGSIL